MTRTLRQHGRAIALLAGREVFRKHSENSAQQKEREECPLLVRLGTLIHPNPMAAQVRLKTPASRAFLRPGAQLRPAATRRTRTQIIWRLSRFR